MDNQPNRQRFTSHTLSLSERKRISLTGITKVLGASPSRIELTSCMGKLTVDGSELEIVKFDDSDGTLIAAGNIDSIKYDKVKQPLLKRIFK